MNQWQMPKCETGDSDAPPRPYRRLRFRWKKADKKSPHPFLRDIETIRVAGHTAAIFRINLPTDRWHMHWLAMLDGKAVLNQGWCRPEKEARYYGPWPEDKEADAARPFRQRHHARRWVEAAIAQERERQRLAPPLRPWASVLLGGAWALMAGWALYAWAKEE